MHALCFLSHSYSLSLTLSAPHHINVTHALSRQLNHLLITLTADVCHPERASLYSALQVLLKLVKPVHYRRRRHRQVSSDQFLVGTPVQCGSDQQLVNSLIAADPSASPVNAPEALEHQHAKHSCKRERARGRPIQPRDCKCRAQVCEPKGSHGVQGCRLQGHTGAIDTQGWPAQDRQCWWRSAIA